MRNVHKRLLSLLAALAVVAGFATTAMAADHRDAPSLLTDNGGDPAADINDLYAFRSTDAGDPASDDRTVFIMTVFPLADGTSEFSDAVDYEFVIDGGDAGQLVITCSTTAGVMSCNGDDGTTQTAGVLSTEATDNALRLAATDLIYRADHYEDPFFFDLEDFQTVYTTGDPTELANDEGTDFFAGADVLAIIVDVHSSVLPGTDLAVWGRTVRQGN